MPYVASGIPGTGASGSPASLRQEFLRIQEAFAALGSVPISPGQLTGVPIPAANITGQLTAAQIASINAAQLTGQITGAQIASGAISGTQFASGIEPITVLSSVPGSRVTSLIFNVTDGRVYRWADTAYVNTNATNQLIGQLTAGQITAGAIGTDQLAANAVTADRIAAGAVTTTRLAAGAVSANEIAGFTITANQIATDAITTRTIAAGAVTAGEISVSSLSAVSATLGSVNVGAGGAVNGGAFTGFSWPSAGQTGFHLGQSGLMIGNLNDGRYFQVTAGGNVTAPGFSIVNGVANFSGVSIDGIGRIQGIGTGNNTVVNNTFITLSGGSGTVQINGAGGGSVTGIVMPGNPVTSGNVSTYIASQAIGDAQIGTLSANKITTGTLDASRIAAGSITARHLVLTGKGLNPDPTFSGAGERWLGFIRRLARTNGAVPSNCPAAFASEFGNRDNMSLFEPLSVVPGEQYRITCWVSGGGSGSGDIGALFYGYDLNGSVTQTPLFAVGANSGWQFVSGVWTVPAGVTRLLPGVWTNRPGGYSGASWFADLAVEKMNGGELIVDGAITAQKIFARTITTDRIEVGAVTAAGNGVQAFTSGPISSSQTEIGSLAPTGLFCSGGGVPVSISGMLQIVIQSQSANTFNNAQITLYLDFDAFRNTLSFQTVDVPASRGRVVSVSIPFIWRHFPSAGQHYYYFRFEASTFDGNGSLVLPAGSPAWTVLGFLQAQENKV